MNRINKPQAIIFIILILIVGIGGLIYFLNIKNANNEAEYWYNKAVHNFGSESTVQNAHDWLADNNFTVWIWDSSSEFGWISAVQIGTGSTKEEYYGVKGSKLLIEGFWIDMQFLFDLEYKFHSIKYHIREHPLPLPGQIGEDENSGWKIGEGI